VRGLGCCGADGANYLPRGAARGVGLLGWVWYDRLRFFFSLFLFPYFLHNFCILALNELKPISNFL
jgi:hypothetical protein